jgi:hypothetical protein
MLILMNGIKETHLEHHHNLISAREFLKEVEEFHEKDKSKKALMLFKDIMGDIDGIIGMKNFIMLKFDPKFPRLLQTTIMGRRHSEA